MTFFAAPKAHEQAAWESGVANSSRTTARNKTSYAIVQFHRLVPGPGTRGADTDMAIKSTAVRCPTTTVGRQGSSNTTNAKNPLKEASKKSSRKRPSKVPPQDPVVTMQIITDQAAFATEIMQRERALAGKQPFQNSSHHTFNPLASARNPSKCDVKPSPLQ